MEGRADDERWLIQIEEQRSSALVPGLHRVARAGYQGPMSTELDRRGRLGVRIGRSFL
jgi:hypothetical protein